MKGPVCSECSFLRHKRHEYKTVTPRGDSDWEIQDNCLDVYTCHRFPAVVIKQPDDFCGEFKAKED